jgi:predicted lysophospholipase L1 biosynthesis ABC-type transport system permease subunit
MFRELEKIQTVLTGIAAHSEFRANLAVQDKVLAGNGLLVSGGYFQVRAMMLGRVGIMTLVGIAIGLFLGITIGRTAGFMPYRLQGSDPAVIGISVVIPVLVSPAAGFIPVYRASRIEPMQALRRE